MKTQFNAASKKHRKTPVAAASPATANRVDAKSGDATAAEVKPNMAAPTAFPAFSVEHAMAVIEKLRTSATDHHQQFVVQGRKAMLELMSQVYEQYYNAKASNEFEAFSNNVRNKLKNLGLKIRDSSVPSSLLIRLIFADFDDKQVHVYGRSLDVALERETLPEDFKLFVGTEGGFEGIRRTAKDKAGVDSAIKVEIAFNVVVNEPTVNTLLAEGWGDDERYRVYIAISNNDGTADIKDSKLGKEHLEATLLLVKLAKERRDNPPKPKKASSAEVNEADLLQLETRLKNEQTKQAQLKSKYKAAVNSGDVSLEDSMMTALSKSIEAAYGYERELFDLQEKSKKQ
jgi:hypothetical protein